jgi:hypothetical protein
MKLLILSAAVSAQLDALINHAAHATSNVLDAASNSLERSNYYRSSPRYRRYGGHYQLYANNNWYRYRYHNGHCQVYNYYGRNQWTGWNRQAWQPYPQQQVIANQWGNGQVVPNQWNNGQQWGQTNQWGMPNSAKTLFQSSLLILLLL